MKRKHDSTNVLSWVWIMLFLMVGIITTSIAINLFIPRLSRMSPYIMNNIICRDVDCIEEKQHLSLPSMLVIMHCCTGNYEYENSLRQSMSYLEFERVIEYACMGRTMYSFCDNLEIRADYMAHFGLDVCAILRDTDFPSLDDFGQAWFHHIKPFVSKPLVYEYCI